MSLSTFWFFTYPYNLSFENAAKWAAIVGSNPAKFTHRELSVKWILILRGDAVLRYLLLANHGWIILLSHENLLSARALSRVA